MIALAVIQVYEAEQTVARQQREPDGRLHLIAPHERAVDLRRSVPGDQLLSRDRQPDGRAIVMDREVVRDFALAEVGHVTRQLLTHVGQRVEQALLRLTVGKRRVVGAARLFVKKDRDDVRAGGVLHVGDDAAKHGC